MLHFEIPEATWHEVGFKALAVNISDIAAMGCLPRHALDAIAVGPGRSRTEIEDLFAGSADDTFSISGIQSHQVDTGDGDDVVVLADAAQLVGTVDAGQGTDSLDLSGYTTDTTVTVTSVDSGGFSGTGTALTGGFIGIDAVTSGGGAADTLTGLENDSTWTISAAGGGQYVDMPSGSTLDFSGTDLLVSGSGDDTFTVASGGSVGSIDAGGGTDSLVQAELSAFATHPDPALSKWAGLLASRAGMHKRVRVRDLTEVAFWGAMNEVKAALAAAGHDPEEDIIVTRVSKEGYRPYSGGIRLEDGRDITDVSPLAGLTKLETLWLESNRLTDISTLKGLTQLVNLTLSNNNLTNGQLKYLTGLKQLKVLNLGSNQLTNVSTLEVLKQLRFLHLQNNPDLTKAEVDNLQKALPNCLITHNAKK